MWTCDLLKRNARAALSQRYGKSVILCLVAALLGVSGTSSVGFSVIYQAGRSAFFGAGEPEIWTGNNSGSSFLYDQLWYYGLIPFVIGAAVVALVAVLCWQVLLAGPLAVGRSRYFMESRQGYSPFGTLFSTLRRPYWNVVKGMALTNLKIFAGSLLVIPGIYWAYCYRLVPYLLAENPYLSTARAMELSRQMMQGEKWHSFLLELSFLGWELLCLLTAGIGYLFLEPYLQAAFAELYAALRSKAFAAGMTDASELAGFMRY